jgi:hypothetical protein
MTGNEASEAIGISTPQLEKMGYCEIYLHPEVRKVPTESTTLPPLMATKVGIAVTRLSRSQYQCDHSWVFGSLTISRQLAADGRHRL